MLLKTQHCRRWRAAERFGVCIAAAGVGDVGQGLEHSRHGMRGKSRPTPPHASTPKYFASGQRRRWRRGWGASGQGLAAWEHSLGADCAFGTRPADAAGEGCGWWKGAAGARVWRPRRRMRDKAAGARLRRWCVHHEAKAKCVGYTRHGPVHVQGTAPPAAPLGALGGARWWQA
jgi:hypothetical protein